MDNSSKTVAVKSQSVVTEDFSFLGLGGKKDRLNFRLVMHIFRRSFPFLKPVIRHFFILIGIAIPISLYGIVMILMTTGLIFTNIFQGKPLGNFTAWLLGLDPAVYVTVEQLTAEARLSLRWEAIFLILLAFPVMVILGSGVAYYQLWIIQRINQLLRVQLIERIQAMSMRFHTGTKIGDAIYRVYQDSAMVTNIIRSLIIDPTRIIITFFFGVLVSGLFDPLLALIIILTVIPIMILGSRFSPKMRQEFRAMRETNSELTSQIQETIAGIKAIKANGSEKTYQMKFESHSLTAFAAAFNARYRLALLGMLGFFIIAIGLVIGEARLAVITSKEAVTWAVSLLALIGYAKFNIGAYTSARGNIDNGLSNLERILILWGRLQDMAIGLDRVFDVLDLEPEVRDADDAIEMPTFKNNVIFENISFGYTSDNIVIKNVNLKANAGEITALIGPTGSGKTTLVNLLLHLYELNDGAIYIDGININRIKLESIRQNISIALQENILFGTTIRENIRYAVPGATDEQVIAASKIACAHEYISALPQGYDTLLGERGAKLSTGERQRLSIARAVIKNTPILILDEPTAALDAETELAVVKNLTRWGRDRAIFLITHRLSTIRQADQIIYLQEGEVIESGSHKTLINTENSAYRRFVELEENHRSKTK